MRYKLYTSWNQVLQLTLSSILPLFIPLVMLPSSWPLKPRLLLRTIGVYQVLYVHE